ncbi:hypothetical protein X798_03940 [Onchocerca flexuosa]|uniref:Uncharacterized protein n=1 Tax=Onchocerca flexuosa TaxID=387005 RepID=A0A238BWG1_9BILA|nr:hypothetical protein X798_03940 [Onchocerca flexuosa]
MNNSTHAQLRLQLKRRGSMSSCGSAVQVEKINSLTDRSHCMTGIFSSFVRLLLSSTLTNISFSLEKSLVHAAGQYTNGGAGYVTPMAVMVAPSRVDYSVTKGGLRLWVVLLVFVILCSSFYTLFSTMELAELAFGNLFVQQQHNSFVEFDGDENFDFDGDIDDDADEMAIHNRRAEKDTTPSREYISRSKTVEENRKAHQAIQDVPDSSILNSDDDILNEEEISEEEEARLADLRAKAERKSNKPFVESVVEQADLPSRTKGRHMEEEDKTSRKQNKEKDKPKRAKGHRKRIKVMEDDEEEEERTMAQKVELEKEEEQEETDGRNVQIEDSIEHEEKKSAVVNEGKESEHEYDTEKPKLKSRRKIPSFNMEKSKRECKRKNCLPEYDHHPRMSLLKEVPFSVKNRNKQQSIAGSKSIENDEKEEEITDADDEWENEGIENKELDDESIRDLAAIKKEKFVCFTDLSFEFVNYRLLN